MADKELTRVVRAGFEKFCSEFTDRVSQLGFRRSLKTFWTKTHPHSVDVIHFHRGGSSYEAPSTASVDIRIHLAIRVLNDDFDAVSLNGPSTDNFLAHRPRYHLSFNAKSLSQYDRCRADAVRFVEEQGLPWFSNFSTAEALLSKPDSPLSSDARERLRVSIADGSDPEAVAGSRKLLGLRA